MKRHTNVRQINTDESFRRSKLAWKRSLPTRFYLSRNKRASSNSCAVIWIRTRTSLTFVTQAKQFFHAGVTCPCKPLNPRTTYLHRNAPKTDRCVLITAFSRVHFWSNSLKFLGEQKRLPRWMWKSTQTNRSTGRTDTSLSREFKCFMDFWISLLLGNYIGRRYVLILLDRMRWTPPHISFKGLINRTISFRP